MLTRVIPRLYALLRADSWIGVPALERLYLAAFFAYKRYVEDPFAALVRARPDLFRGGDIIDVGANVGYTAIVFARAVEQPYRVYALEPEETNFRRLTGVVRRRRLEKKVIPVRTAAGDRSGEIGLLVNPHHPGDHHVSMSGGDVRVPVTTLDDFVDRHAISAVTFVKLDVQGFELTVSRGMERLLARFPRAAVAFEYSAESETFGSSLRDLLTFYEQRGLEIRLLTRRADLAAAEERPITEAVSKRGYVDLLALPRECARGLL